MWWDDLRSSEGGKIGCAKVHFKAIEVDENSATYKKAVSLSQVL